VVTGVRLRTAGGMSEIRAPVTIAADGRTSTIASSLGLPWRPAFPARWAVGAHFEGVHGLRPWGEMHVRAGYYLGVAPLPGGLANAILVVPLAGARGSGAPLPQRLAQFLAGDPELGPRFSAARQVAPATILGPMAVDVRPPEGHGVLLAGDAAGFIDPMTGDGMRFAIGGGALAARAALDVLEHGWDGASRRHADRYRQAFGRKRRFNRAVRRLTASAAAVRALDTCAPLLAPLFSRLIAYAGDVHVRERE
jgi:flavin-dependent dehydrogenase